MKQSIKTRAIAVADDRQRVVLRYGAILLLGALVAGAVAGSALGAPQRRARANLDEFTKVDLDSLDEKYQVFYDEVKVILTPEERDVFLRLESEFQRDEFIRRFWDIRDPSPGTPKNEYYDLFQERLEYVEKHYGRGTPRRGRKTDQGRMYLLLGEPMNVKAMPWTQMAYPVEIWWFHANPKLGIPPFFYLVFFKRQGVGEFRLYSPMVDGPAALLNPAGREAMQQIRTGEGRARSVYGDDEVAAALDVLQRVDAELAQVSISLIPGGQGGQVGVNSMSSAMMMGDIESIPETIMPSAAWAYPILTGMVEADVRFETLPIRARAVALLDPSGQAFLHYGVMTDGQKLNLNQYEDNWYVTFQIAGTVADRQSRIVTSVKGADGATVKTLQADLDKAAATRLRSGPLLYLDRLAVVPGNYSFNLVLENNVSREYGSDEINIDVPAPWPTVLRSSDPLLVWGVFNDPNYDAYADHYPFQIGTISLIPALDPLFSANTGISVFHQVYLPRGYSATIRATYRLSRDGEVVLEVVDSIDPAEADRFGTIHQTMSLDTSGFADGEYDLFIDIDGDASGGITHTVTLDSSIDVDDPPHLHMSPGPPPTDPFVAYDRALQLRIQGETDAAIEMLASAVDRVEDDTLITLQIELLMEGQRYDDVQALLRPRLINDPNDIPLLIALGEVATQTGNTGDAVRYFERVRLVSSVETTDVLNPLAAAYFGEGRVDKAREILELSLTVDPNQAEIRRLLDEVLAKGQGR